MTALSINRLALTLGESEVLRDISLRVKAGEFVSILGPSGCGKSTLFRLLIGELRPDQGSIVLEGDAPRDQGAAFAFMPQRDALLPWRRIIDNITLGLEVQGVTRAEAQTSPRH